MILLSETILLLLERGGGMGKGGPEKNFFSTTIFLFFYTSCGEGVQTMSAKEFSFLLTPSLNSILIIREPGRM